MYQWASIQNPFVQLTQRWKIRCSFPRSFWCGQPCESLSGVRPTDHGFQAEWVFRTTSICPSWPCFGGTGTGDHWIFAPGMVGMLWICLCRFTAFTTMLHAIAILWHLRIATVFIGPVFRVQLSDLPCLVLNKFWEYSIRGYLRMYVMYIHTYVTVQYITLHYISTVHYITVHTVHTVHVYMGQHSLFPFTGWLCRLSGGGGGGGGTLVVVPVPAISGWTIPWGGRRSRTWNVST